MKQVEKTEYKLIQWHFNVGGKLLQNCSSNQPNGICHNVVGSKSLRMKTVWAEIADFTQNKYWSSPQNSFMNRFLRVVCTDVGSSEQLWVATSSVSIVCSVFVLHIISSTYASCSLTNKNKVWKILYLGNIDYLQENNSSNQTQHI